MRVAASTLVIMIFLSACSASTLKNDRKIYLSKCEKRKQFYTNIKDKLRAAELCICIFDQTIARVDKKYKKFTSEFLLISDGRHYISDNITNKYNTLITSRSDGKLALHHSLKAIKSAGRFCKKTK